MKSRQRAPRRTDDFTISISAFLFYFYFFKARAIEIYIIMSSGWSMSGGPARCFSNWSDFSVCMESEDDMKKCSGAFEDYFECLHHGKEIARRNRVEAELRKKGGKSFLKKAQEEAAAAAASTSSKEA